MTINDFLLSLASQAFIYFVFKILLKQHFLKNKTQQYHYVEAKLGYYFFMKGSHYVIYVFILS